MLRSMTAMAVGTARLAASHVMSGMSMPEATPTRAERKCPPTILRGCASGLFAAPKEWKPRKAPNLVFGVISDLSIPKSELPPGTTLAITVHPSSCLASKGKPVTAIFNTVTGAVR